MRIVTALMVLLVVMLWEAKQTALGSVTRVFPKEWLRGALCVHRHEASWTNPGLTWDGRPSPYYGGMQFDLQTWRANGGYRYASYPYRATATEQLRVAYVTWQRRGWYPWPRTARMCGLL